MSFVSVDFILLYILFFIFLNLYSVHVPKINLLKKPSHLIGANMSTRCVQKEMKGHGDCRGWPPLLRNPALFWESEPLWQEEEKHKSLLYLITVQLHSEIHHRTCMTDSIYDYGDLIIEWVSRITKLLLLSKYSVTRKPAAAMLNYIT